MTEASGTTGATAGPTIGATAGSTPARQARAIAEMNPDGAPRKVLFVAGAGRSVTSKMAVLTSLLCLHVNMSLFFFYDS